MVNNELIKKYLGCNTPEWIIGNVDKLLENEFIKKMENDLNSIRPIDHFKNNVLEEKHSLINVQLRIKENAVCDNVLSLFMKSLRYGTEIMDGVIVEQIYFNGVTTC